MFTPTQKMLCLIIVIGLSAAVSASVKPEDVKFFLTNSEVTLQEVETGDHGNVDPTKDFIIVCHGWLDSVDSSWYLTTKAEYVKKGYANVIAVDWSVHAGGLYSSSLRRIGDVGYYVALLILDLSSTYNLPLSKFHLIGHSLGAHIFGFSGKHIIEMTGEKIGRITGLDPAGPGFEGVAESKRLSSNDATFVDVMHTDGGVAGYKASIGHVDYFPNGGTSRQNGCGLLSIGCSHNRAPIYFYESINSDAFVAVACTSTRDFDRGRCSSNQRISMGENVDRTARGDFYLNTARSSPYGLGNV